MKKLKQIFAFALVAVMMVTLTACGEPSVDSLIDKYAVSETLGIQIPLGSAFDEFDGYYGITETGVSIINGVDCYGTLQYDFLSKEGNAIMDEINAAKEDGSATEEELNERYNTEVLSQKKTIARMYIFDKAELEENLASGRTIQEITGYDENYKMMDRNGSSYYFCYPAQEDTANLDSQAKGMYKKLRKTILATKNQFVVLGLSFEKAFKPEAGRTMGDFTSFDLNGTTVAKYSVLGRPVTMIHVWKKEDASSMETLKVLEQLREQYDSSQFDVVGIVADLLTEDVLKTTLEETTANGIQFTNIAPSQDVIDNVLPYVDTFPCTFLVDTDGKVLEVFDGTKTIEEYQQIISKYLGE